MADELSYMTSALRRWRRWTDGPLLLLAIGSLPILLLELQRSDLSAGDEATIDTVNVVVLIAFAVDYAVELRLARDRWSYVRREWTSAVIVLASAAAVTPRLAALGGARVLRAVPAVRAFAAVLRLLAVGGATARDARGLVRRRAVSFAVAVAGLTWLSGAVAFTLAEDVGPGGRVKSFGDALWWSQRR